MSNTSKAPIYAQESFNSCLECARVDVQMKKQTKQNNKNMQTLHATHIAQSFVALPSFKPRITAAEAKPLSVSLPYRHKIRVTNI